SSAAPTEKNRGSSYEPDEDDLTDSALESRGLAPEELARVRSLRDERDGLRTMNAVLEDVLGALKLTEGKMENFQETIDTSHQLLDLYARIASQAEHTKDLLLDGEWQGVERDYEFLAEREQAAREAEEAALREAEEQAAREEAERVRKAQEEHPRQRFVRRSSRFLRSIYATTPNNNNIIIISTDSSCCFLLPRRLLPKHVFIHVWDPDSRIC
ncbi:hypothetical protein B0A53_05420, partial [Rhodotorula sp. CCFEE 5036]